MQALPCLLDLGVVDGVVAVKVNLKTFGIVVGADGRFRLLTVAVGVSGKELDARQRLCLTPAPCSAPRARVSDGLCEGWAPD